MKVLLADDDGQLSRRLADFLKDHGFLCKIASNGKEARNQILEWKPRFVLADLMLPDGNALELLKYIREQNALKNDLINLLVLSGHNNEGNVKKAFKGGAVDYLVKPMEFSEILKRIVFQMRRTKTINPTKEENDKDESTFLLYLTEIMMKLSLSQENADEVLFNLTKMVAKKMDGVRCNIIRYFNQAQGAVVTSSDDEKAVGIQLNLNKYPEVVNVVNTGQVMAIEDLESNEDMKLIKSELMNISFNSMIVCPIEFHGKTFGVLSLRMPESKKSFTNNEMRFVSIAAHIVSLALCKKKTSIIEGLQPPAQENAA